METIFYGPRVISVFEKETIGGGTILFENLISEIDKHYSYINTNGNSDRISEKFLHNLKLIFTYIFKPSQSRVLFAAHRQAILFLFIDFLIRRKTVYRLIGGNFKYWFKNPVVKFLLKSNAKISKILCELPEDLLFFKTFKIQCEIQENFRSISESRMTQKKLTSNKFTVGFIGRVCDGKGIYEFIDLAKTCSNHNFIIAGPFESQKEKESILKIVSKIRNLSYQGVFPHSKINSFFNQIDVFFFHSNHIGEGKPGVLVECLLRDSNNHKL